MEFDVYDFRHAREILQNREPWHELRGVIEDTSMEDIVEVQQQLGRERKRIPRGGQTAINELFRRKLTPGSPPDGPDDEADDDLEDGDEEEFEDRLTGWHAEVPLFEERSRLLRGWAMDFMKGRVGVEVTFNHAEAIPWTLTRLNLAGEADAVMEPSRIDVGVAIYATDGLKRWSRMDSAVGTFEVAMAWLRLMRPIMPIPVLVVGLKADGWPEVGRDVFPGTGSRR